MVKWYSLFSHTGKETEAVWNLLKDKLHLEAAITNNNAYEGPLPYIKLISGKYVNEWLMEPGNVEPGSIITLNGYMRIIPAEVLEYLASINCKVYNIHPAPIQIYPDLRGKDPQEALYAGLQSGKYSFIGAVIHKVDAGVDTGEIVHWQTRMPVDIRTKDDLYGALHAMGTAMWVEFFREEMWKDGTSN